MADGDVCKHLVADLDRRSLAFGGRGNRSQAFRGRGYHLQAFGSSHRSSFTLGSKVHHRLETFVGIRRLSFTTLWWHLVSLTNLWWCTLIILDKSLEAYGVVYRRFVSYVHSRLRAFG